MLSPLAMVKCLCVSVRNLWLDAGSGEVCVSLSVVCGLDVASDHDACVSVRSLWLDASSGVFVCHCL